MTPQPIETHYAGCRFRSRLEARWAVFFNTVGIRWEYEPQGYTLGEGKRRYLPDFWLPDLATLVEVKGDPNRLDMGVLIDAVSIEGVNWVMILGPIPEVQEGLAPIHTMLGEEVDFRETDSVWRTQPDGEDRRTLDAAVAGLPEGQRAAALRALRYLDRPTVNAMPIAWMDSPQSGAVPFPICYSNLDRTAERLLSPSLVAWVADQPRVQAAYTAARSARFEHGESG